MTALRERKRKMVDGMTDSESIGRLLLWIHDRVSFLFGTQTVRRETHENPRNVMEDGGG